MNVAGLVIKAVIAVAVVFQTPQPRAENPILGSFELKEAEREISLIWTKAIVPGDDIVQVKVHYTRYDRTYYLRYKFSGVVSNSMMVGKTGGTQDKGDVRASESPSLTDTLYVERADDGGFYFIPEEVNGVGVLRIKRDSQQPGRYLVTFERTK